MGKFEGLSEIYSKKQYYFPMTEEESWNFLEEPVPRVMFLATVGEDNMPHDVPIMFVAHNRKICFDSIKWRNHGKLLHRKVRGIMHNPYVCLALDSLLEGKGSYGVSMLGKAEIIDKTSVETVWDEKWKERYDELMAKVKVPLDSQQVHAQQELVWFDVTPERISSWDFRKWFALAEAKLKE